MEQVIKVTIEDVRRYSVECRNWLNTVPMSNPYWARVQECYRWSVQVITDYDKAVKDRKWRLIDTGLRIGGYALMSGGFVLLSNTELAASILSATKGPAGNFLIKGATW